MIVDLRSANTKLAPNRLRGHQPRLNDHTDCGVGGRQYGTSKDIETLHG
jgi:hypothetical protein